MTPLQSLSLLFHAGPTLFRLFFFSSARQSLVLLGSLDFVDRVEEKIEKQFHLSRRWKFCVENGASFEIKNAGKITPAPAVSPQTDRNGCPVNEISSCPVETDTLWWLFTFRFAKKNLGWPRLVDSSGPKPVEFITSRPENSCEKKKEFGTFRGPIWQCDRHQFLISFDAYWARPSGHRSLGENKTNNNKIK